MDSFDIEKTLLKTLGPESPEPEMLTPGEQAQALENRDSETTKRMKKLFSQESSAIDLPALNSEKNLAEVAAAAAAPY